MATCYKNNSNYKEIVDYLVKNGISKENAEDYATRKAIATSGKMCEKEYALAECKAMHGGDEMFEEAADKLSERNNAIDKNEIPKIESGLGTNVDDLTGQKIENLNTLKQQENDRRTEKNYQFPRILGGRGREEKTNRVLEQASSITRRTTGTNEQQKGFYKEQFLAQVELKALEHGIWINNVSSEFTARFKSKGNESEVYFTKDNRKIIKLNRFTLLDDEHGIEEFIDRINSHNETFPDLKYEILGFAENSDGEVCIVMQQPYIQGTEASQEDIDNYLIKLGFKKDTLSDGYSGWTNGIYEIWDAEPKNVLKDNNGKLYFIDVVVNNIERVNKYRRLYFQKGELGREFYTSELAAMIPYASKKLHSNNDRANFEADINKIASEFGVIFSHVKEDKLWEKHRWSCSDKRFIDFVREYSKQGKFVATKTMWEQWKSLHSEDGSISTNYNKEAFDLEKRSRFDFITAYCDNKGIEFTEEEKDLFIDPSLVEGSSDKIIAADNEYNYWKKRFPSITELIHNEDTVMVDDYLKADANTAKAVATIENLSQNLGIDYEIIDDKEAETILAEKGIKYNANVHCSFFANGKTYFIKGKINQNTVIHEFSHPLIASIRKDNRKLFDNLFSQLKETNTWNAIEQKLEDDYPELDKDSDLYKEEALVYAMEYAHTHKSDEGFFKKSIEKIIYAIKQLLRKTFGQGINISDLSVDTTVGDLMAMLENSVKFNINVNDVTNEDIVQFKKEELELNDEVMDFFNKNRSIMDEDLKNFNQSVNLFSNYLKAYMNKLRSDGNLEQLKELQTSILGTGELDKIVGEIKLANNEKKFVTLSDVDVLRQRTQHFSNALANLTYITAQIKKDVKELTKGEIYKDNCKTLYSYFNLMEHWSKFLDEFNKQIGEVAKDNDVKPTLINKIVGEAKNDVESVRSMISDKFLDMAADTVYDQLRPMYEKINDQFQNRINVKLKDAPQKIRDNEFKRFVGMKEDEYKTYNEYKDKEERGVKLSIEETKHFNELKLKCKDGLLKDRYDISEMLRGNMGDANFLNSKMEGYMYSTDPLIGGMAKFYKKMLTSSLNKTVNEANRFHMEIQPLMEKVGFSKTKIGSLGKELGFRDKKWHIDKDGKGSIQEVWTFLNEFKDWQAEIGMLEHDVETKYNAYNQSSTVDNWNAYVEAKDRLDDFKYKYMNQEYVHEYYEARKIMNDTVGREAKARMDEINEQIEVEKSNYEMLDAMDDSTYDARKEILDRIDILRKDMRQLSSEYDETGNLKTGLDLSIAKKIREYNQNMNKFYRNETDYESFDKDFMAFRQSLLDAGIKDNSDRYKKEMDLWLRRCVRQSTTPEFDERRQELLNEIIELGVESENSEKWRNIFAIVNGTRDNMGHINTNLLTNEQKKLIRDIQDSMGREDISDELKDALREYNSMVEKIPTTYYMDSLTDMLADCNVTIDILKNEFGCDSVEEFAEYLVSSKLDTTKLENYYSISNPGETLYDWFIQNHYKSSKGNPSLGINPTYSRYYYNNVTIPADKNDMMKYNVVNPQTGNVVATIDGMPAGRYTTRIVKDEYKTEKIVGETVDNKNRWLPKDRKALSQVSELSDDVNSDDYRFKFINTDYERMKRENPDKFKLLEEFKKETLRIQEHVSPKNRLYLEFPRYVQNSAETLANTTTEGIANTMKQYGSRLKQFAFGSPDDFEEGVGDYNIDFVKVDAVTDDFDRIPVGGLYNVDADDCSTNIQYTLFRYASDCYKEEEMRENSSFFAAMQQAIKKNGVKSDKADKAMLESSGVIDRIIHKNSKVREEAYDNFIEKNYMGVAVKGVAANHPFLIRFANALMGRASFSFFAFNPTSALKNSGGISFQSLVESGAGSNVDALSLAKGSAWATDAMVEMALKGNYDGRNDKSFKRKVIEQFDFKQDKTKANFADPMWRSVTTDILDGKMMTAPREWLEDRATYQVGSGMLIFQKVNMNGKMVSYMDALCEKDGVIDVKDGVDVRYSTKETTYIPQSGDTYESIAKKFNIYDPKGKGSDYVKAMATDLSKRINNIEKAKRDYERRVDYANKYLTGNELDKELEDARKDYDKLLENNSITLKNDMYHEVRSKIHGVIGRIGGDYADYDQPEFQRYFLYRITFYLRRYFVPMFLKRFKLRETISPALGYTEKGYYVTALNAIWKTLTSRGTYAKYMSPEEGQAFMKTMVEFALLAAIPVLCKIIFGYDDDDKDRFKKLRRMSGALEAPFVENEGGRRFNLDGYMKLRTLHLILQIQQENEQFMPFMGGMNQIEQMTDIKSVMFGPTTDQVRLVLNDLKEMAFDDDKGYYTRDTGPFVWQKKDSPKIVNHMLKFIAITGSEIDPAMAIQNLESQRAKVRR